MANHDYAWSLLCELRRRCRCACSRGGPQGFVALLEATDWTGGRAISQGVSRWDDSVDLLQTTCAKTTRYGSSGRKWCREPLLLTGAEEIRTLIAGRRGRRVGVRDAGHYAADHGRDAEQER